MDKYNYKIEDVCVPNSGLTASFATDWCDKTRLIIDAQSVTFRVGVNGKTAIDVFTVERLGQELQNVESITLNGITYVKSNESSKCYTGAEPTPFNDADYSSTTPAILGKGHYKNHDYIIMYIGSHPCAYVQCEKDLYNLDGHVGCPVHCGLTYFGDLLHWDLMFPGNHDLFKQTFIGWDYGHIEDYDNHYERYPEEIGGKKLRKWKTYEIHQNVYEVIDWMVKYGY